MNFKHTKEIEKLFEEKKYKEVNKIINKRCDEIFKEMRENPNTIEGYLEKYGQEIAELDFYQKIIKIQFKKTNN